MAKEKLGSLGVIRYAFKKGIDIEVFQEGDGFFASINKGIADYGEGVSASEAIDDLRQNIIDVYNFLKSYQHCLGKEPKRELRWLEKNIKIEWSDY